jgi:hypothetical protein
MIINIIDGEDYFKFFIKRPSGIYGRLGLGASGISFIILIIFFFHCLVLKGPGGIYGRLVYFDFIYIYYLVIFWLYLYYLVYILIILCRIF